MESLLGDSNMDQGTKKQGFGGATLQLDNEGNPTQGGGGLPGSREDVDFRGPGLNRDRPFSASTVSRQSTTSTGSKTKVSPNAATTDFAMDSMFCYKARAFEKAVEHCQEVLCDEDIDGQVEGAWIVSEIDHWDNEREKLVLLTNKSLLIIKYDFIASKVKEHRRIPLNVIDRVMVGDLVYPEKSLMPSREHGGIRVLWNHGQELSFGQKWNPFCTDIPYITFSHHPAMYNEKERETVTYNVDDFYESLVQAVNKVFKRQKPGEALQIIEGPIMIESYASLSSMVFNQSHIGFNRERGGISF